MSTVVSCPECQRKLKIELVAVGKAVKCPCGNVFKADPSAEPPAPPAPAPAPAMLHVSCEGCGIKLKVPASSRGKKMQCAKCATIFVVPAEAAAAAPPAHKSTPPAFMDEDAAPPSAQKSAPPRPPFFDDEAEDEPRAVKKSAAPPPFQEDDQGHIAVAGTRQRGKGAPAEEREPAAEKAAAPASGCMGCVLSVFVFFIVLAYAGVFVPVYLGYVTTDHVGLKPPEAHHHGRLRLMHPVDDVGKDALKDDNADKKPNDADKNGENDRK